MSGGEADVEQVPCHGRPPISPQRRGPMGGTLLAAIALVPNRGDLRLKAGGTYVSLALWPEALEQLRVARFYLPPEEHEPVDKLVATADTAYQAGFFPPEVAE